MLGFFRHALSAITAVAVFLIGLGTAAAQVGGASYVTPFPQGDTYKVQVVGDSLAEGLIYGLRATMKTEPRISLAPNVSKLTRATFNTFDTKFKNIKSSLLTSGSHIAIVVLGTQDRRRIRAKNGRRYWIGTPEWRAEYARRIDEMMKSLKGSGIAVYWVGLPKMRSRDADAGAQIINEIIRERAYLNSIRFIDIYNSFVDEQGAYSAFGPDMGGNVKRLRWRDGIHFTGAGYGKVAHYVTREIKRDLKQAKAERNVPLAGGESAQAAIRAAVKEETKKKEQALTGWKASVDEAKQKVTERQAPQQFFLNAAGGEQKAEHGRINLKSVDLSGQEKIISLEILRPAIPASVVALVTRKKTRSRAARLGDTLVDETTNGLNIMSTVTPPSAAAAIGTERKLSLARTPFFRVLVKGERLPARSGRADDFSWPPPPLPTLPEETVEEELIEEIETEAGGILLPQPSPFRPRA
ncbi:MAG: DUF459 domain-containing protein [Filomicrobium sp.]